MLMGIAVLVFGSAIVVGGSGGTGETILIYIGWIVSLLGLILTAAGYLSSDEEKQLD